MAFQSINGRVFMDHADITTSAGENNDINASNSCLVVETSNDGDSITGIVSDTYVSGEIVWIVNVSETNNLILKNEDNSSAVGNRIFTPNGSDYIVPPKKQAQLMYIDKPSLAGWWLSATITIFDNDIQIPSNAAIYMGSPNVDSSWRFVRSGDDLLLEQRESGVWNVKQTFSGA